MTWNDILERYDPKDMYVRYDKEWTENRRVETKDLGDGSVSVTVHGGRLVDFETFKREVFPVWVLASELERMWYNTDGFWFDEEKKDPWIVDGDRDKTEANIRHRLEDRDEDMLNAVRGFLRFWNEDLAALGKILVDKTEKLYEYGTVNAISWQDILDRHNLPDIYNQYRTEWGKQNVSPDAAKKTVENYKEYLTNSLYALGADDPTVPEDENELDTLLRETRLFTFEEYVEESGYANGLYPPNLADFLDNVYPVWALASELEKMWRERGEYTNERQHPWTDSNRNRGRTEANIRDFIMSGDTSLCNAVKTAYVTAPLFGSEYNAQLTELLFLKTQELCGMHRVEQKASIKDADKLKKNRGEERWL